MKKTTLVLALISMTTFGTLQAQIDRGGTTTTETREKEDGKYSTKGDEAKPKVTKADKAEKQDQMNKQDRQSSPASADAQSRAKEMTDKLDEVLDLSTEQYQKAMQVNLKYVNQLEEMKARNDGNAANKEQMKAKKDELSRERLNQYKSFLTKEQWSKFEAHRGDMKEDYNSDKGNMSKEDKKERMDNMTPEEKQKMQEKKDQKKGSN